MNLKVYEESKNYTATVVRMKTLDPVPWLDNLVRTTVFGNDCLVSKDSDQNKLYLFFPAETILSPSFLAMNNLFRHSERNSDPSSKGFFEDSGRVKALKFKGIISTGFVIPITSLMFLAGKRVSELHEGDEFNEINGIEVCRKFVKPVQVSGGKGGKATRKLVRFDKMIPNQFRFHESTANFYKFMETLNPNGEAVITNKLHGTSAVFANVLVNRKLSRLEKIARFFGAKVQETEYDLLYSSRTVLKNRYITKDNNLGFYWEDIWGVVMSEIAKKIEKGITIYGEIVGFTPGGSAIQKWYDYGCQGGEHRFFVYRITSTNVDGEVMEFDWEAIKRYCERYSLNYVPEIEIKLIEDIALSLPCWLEIDCDMSRNKVPAEGVCIRLCDSDKFEVYKAKSKRFLEYETKMIDEGVEDMEADINIEENV